MTTKYEYYNTGDDDNLLFYSPYWEAQTFTVGAAGHTITSVKLKMYRKGSPSTLTVHIRATDVNGHPTGSDLTNGTINANTFTTDTAGAWYEISLTEYTLLANTKYAIVCSIAAGDINNDVHWNVDASSPSYSGGNEEYSSNSGGSWTSHTSNDLMFEVWGNPTGTARTKTVTEILGLIDTKTRKATYHRTKIEVLGLVDTRDKNKCKKCKPSVIVTF